MTEHSPCHRSTARRHMPTSRGQVWLIPSCCSMPLRSCTSPLGPARTLHLSPRKNFCSQTAPRIWWYRCWLSPVGKQNFKKRVAFPHTLMLCRVSVLWGSPYRRFAELVANHGRDLFIGPTLQTSLKSLLPGSLQASRKHRLGGPLVASATAASAKTRARVSLHYSGDVLCSQHLHSVLQSTLRKHLVHARSCLNGKTDFGQSQS